MSTGRISKYLDMVVANSKPIWRTALYLRLSREDGDKIESDSIANQRKIIDRYLAKNPDLQIYDIYIDDGFSGTNFNRPSMTRLLEDIKSGKVNCLIVKDLSRFGRNYHETGRYLEVVFPLLKLRFISINDNIDSYKNPLSLKNSTVSFKNVMNDEYGRDISNKIRSTFRAKQKRGEYIGSFPLYGYKKDPTDHHKLIIDEEAAETVRLIFNLFSKGVSIYNITQQLSELGILNPTEYKISKGFNVKPKMKHPNTKNCWSTQTIRRMLKNEMYLGNMVQNTYQKVSYKLSKIVSVPKEGYIVKEGTHEAIINKDLFDKVQERFLRDTWQKKGYCGESRSDVETGAIYVGYIKCADCGRAMQRSGYMENGISFYYFVCGSYLQWKQCTRHTTRVKKLNETVLAVIQKYVLLAVETEELLKSLQKTPEEDFKCLMLKKELNACDLEKEKITKFQNDLYMDYKSDIITKEQYFHFKKEYADKLVQLDQRQRELTEKISQAKENVSESYEFLESFKKYKNITSLSREVVMELIDVIYVENEGGIRIRFKFQDLFESALKTLSEKNGISSDKLHDFNQEYAV